VATLTPTRVPATATPQSWPPDRPLPLTDPTEFDSVTASFPIVWDGKDQGGNQLRDPIDLANGRGNRGLKGGRAPWAASLLAWWHHELDGRVDVIPANWNDGNIGKIEAKGMYQSRPWIRFTLALAGGRVTTIDLNLQMSAGGGLGIDGRGYYIYDNTINPKKEGGCRCFTGIKKINPVIFQVGDYLAVDTYDHSKPLPFGPYMIPAGFYGINSVFGISQLLDPSVPNPYVRITDGYIMVWDH
jgi:hypothetical protein